MVVVDLIAATICFLQGPTMTCHNALVGPLTPRGEYTLQQRLTSDAGYGGDVLQFHEDDKAVYAVHRLWTLRPDERRAERIKSSDPLLRRTITKGCINVSPEVYEQLMKCCSTSKIVIK